MVGKMREYYASQVSQLRRLDKRTANFRNFELIVIVGQSEKEYIIRQGA